MVPAKRWRRRLLESPQSQELKSSTNHESLCEAIVLRFVSPTLKHIVFPVLSRTGYLSHLIGDGPAVVTYHGVFPSGYKVRDSALDGNLVTAESLKRQLALLEKRYKVISPDD